MTLTFDASALKVEQTFGQILLFQRLCSQKPINPYGATIMQTTLLSSEPAQAIALHSDISSFAFDRGHGLEHSKPAQETSSSITIKVASSWLEGYLYLFIKSLFLHTNKYN